MVLKFGQMVKEVSWVHNDKIKMILGVRVNNGLERSN